MFINVGPSTWNALPDFLKTIRFLCLPLDASLNISTSHFTSTPSAFEVILKLTRYTNYLLTMLVYIQHIQTMKICLGWYRTNPTNSLLTKAAIYSYN